MAGEQALSKVLGLQGLMSEGSEGLVHVGIDLRGGVGAVFDSSWCTVLVWHSGERQVCHTKQVRGTMRWECECVIS